MLVREFLERQKAADPIAALGFLMDLLALLDEFEDEKCSVLAGKIRGQLSLKSAEGEERTG